MKILNKPKPQEIAFNHSSDVDFKGFVNLYIKCTAKPYFAVVIDATENENLSYFRKKEYKS